MTIIQITELAKSYQKPVLRGINIKINKGEPIALVGANGAGKTTLFSCIAGFIPFDSGVISVLGEQPGSPNLVNRIGVLPQDARLNPDETIEAQLSFLAQLQGLSKAQALAESQRVLGLVDLQAHGAAKPVQLSHGMAKRVAIAQALIGTPELVLLDEPTAGLDPLNARELRQLIKSLSSHTTFIISSHNLDELESLCREVYYLENGQISRHLDLHDQQQSCLSLELLRETPLAKQALEQLETVTQVSSTQDRVFIINYHDNSGMALEQAIFRLLAQQDWPYKLLMQGKTLEESLFG
ncbi:MAG: ABC transporter ATP-binding protein [Shewanella sp.]|uniref:ABC transporter ATP-binding protein n=1 Tax=Shewanella sp. SNU WT4 TaxID=2590015 RepID=UPI00112AF301|nr:ABC transporter ATP-binding protein [Shewanella sp. SNU WT4]QDF66857.1 ABC transporter ATP-binding protein [Shewanella sp. SNU WT4]